MPSAHARKRSGALQAGPGTAAGSKEMVEAKRDSETTSGHAHLPYQAGFPEPTGTHPQGGTRASDTLNHDFTELSQKTTFFFLFWQTHQKLEV